jgi:hypothetical protein
MIGAGVSGKVLSTLMGHSSVDFKLAASVVARSVRIVHVGERLATFSGDFVTTTGNDFVTRSRAPKSVGGNADRLRGIEGSLRYEIFLTPSA